MTFNPNANIGSSNVGRAGGGSLGGGGLMLGGGGGCLMLVVVLIYALMGGNPMYILGGGGQSAPQSQQQSGELSGVEGCETGQDANTNDECLVQGVVESADSLWSQLGPDSGIRWQEPRTLLFSDRVQTGCGGATSAVGPFYCPANTTIYVDASFYQELETRFGASGGQLSKAYVVAHEYGHHIQNLQGTMNSIDRQGTGPQSDAVRLELQADCYAGVWAHHATRTTDQNGQPFLQPLTDQDIRDALSAASAVGDDHIQEDVAGGQANPESWTHGSSEQRMNWFMQGYQEGTVASCDTFSARQV
ncbi:neutral zinc metallopeptidase [Brachybacterium sp. EF45031]|uniref:KPN_02809 family neutral zinc metallopeptidase n=1 Tax=Brachybacterium sillae TaxID=2810536 RepID=UPI00217CDAB1|nr:neutral zinc metallopeptidase [Brachybacterium sillae]MCS6712154.1 neutral zinc metallopeptidase [Brachybacterium sillae]